jgi:hypothetical protein
MMTSREVMKAVSLDIVANTSRNINYYELELISQVLGKTLKELAADLRFNVTFLHALKDNQELMTASASQILKKMLTVALLKIK